MGDSSVALMCSNRCLLDHCLDSCNALQCCNKKHSIKLPLPDQDVCTEHQPPPAHEEYDHRCEDHDHDVSGGGNTSRISRATQRLSALFKQHRRSRHADHVSIMDPRIQRAIHTDDDQDVRGTQRNSGGHEARTDHSVWSDGDNHVATPHGNDAVQTHQLKVKPEAADVPDVVLRVEEETGSLIVDMAGETSSMTHSVTSAYSDVSGNHLQNNQEEVYGNVNDGTVLLAGSTPKQSRSSPHSTPVKMTDHLAR